MGATVLAVVQGTPPEQQDHGRFHDSISTGGPILLFMALVVLLGLYIPPPLDSLLRDAAVSLEVKTMNGIDSFCGPANGPCDPAGTGSDAAVCRLSRDVSSTRSATDSASSHSSVTSPDSAAECGNLCRSGRQRRAQLRVGQDDDWTRTGFPR